MAISMDELMRAFGRPMNPNVQPVQDMRIQGVPAQPASPPMAAPMQAAPAPAPQQQRGLLGGFFGPEGRDARARLAIGLEGLTMNPNQALIGQLQQGIEGRATEKQRNATIEWLLSRDHDDLAAALEAGAEPQAVLAEATRRMQPAGFRQVTGAQLGLTGADAQKLFNVSPENQITAIGGAGTNVTNVIGGEGATSAMNKKLAEAEGATLATYLQQGPVASAALQDLSLLQEILPMAPQGPIVGRAAEFFPGFSSAGSAASSVIKRVAPTLRVEGSGSSSDIEYNGMLQSLPSLQNYPEANAAIVAMMQAKAQINLERSELVRAYSNSAQTDEDAAALRARLSELDARSIMTPELRSIMSRLGGVTQGAAGTVRTYNPKTGRLE